MRSALVISAVSLAAAMAAAMAAALPAAAESVTQFGNSTVIAAEGPGHSLYLYRQSFGASGWKKQLIAGRGTTYSSPSVIRVLSVAVITAGAARGAGPWSAGKGPRTPRPRSSRTTGPP